MPAAIVVTACISSRMKFWVVCICCGDSILPAAVPQFVLFHCLFTGTAFRMLSCENLIDQVNNKLFSWAVCGRQEFFRRTTSISITMCPIKQSKLLHGLGHSTMFIRHAAGTGSVLSLAEISL